MFIQITGDGISKKELKGSDKVKFMKAVLIALIEFKYTDISVYDLNSMFPEKFSKSILDFTKQIYELNPETINKIENKKGIETEKTLNYEILRLVGETPQELEKYEQKIEYLENKKTELQDVIRKKEKEITNLLSRLDFDNKIYKEVESFIKKDKEIEKLNKLSTLIKKSSIEQSEFSENSQFSFTRNLDEI